MTYWLLNAVFLGIVAALALITLATRRRPRWRAMAIAAGVLLIMTAIFDNIMISVGLVGYSADAISGSFVGVAPLEDFAYTVAAAAGLPCLWSILGPRAQPAPSTAASGSPQASEGANA